MNLATDSSNKRDELERYSSAKAEIEFVINKADQLTFADISGDFNPLHLDDGFAKARGLDGTVVYGALIVAKISQILGMQLPGKSGIWSTLKINFRSPLYVGETAHISAIVDHVSQATRTLSLKITVSCEGRNIATANALSTLHTQ